MEDCFAELGTEIGISSSKFNLVGFGPKLILGGKWNPFEFEILIISFCPWFVSLILGLSLG